ncbi:MAG: GNAT family N-acetyltransferase [Methanomassiliicoccales archaeon]|nr:GNAT family N-acetyltransferase [Methanomassiliicoccales archaeon]
MNGGASTDRPRVAGAPGLLSRAKAKAGLGSWSNLLYRLDLETITADVELPPDLTLVRSDAPMVDWPDVRSAASQSPGPGEPKDIWLNALLADEAIGTIAACFRRYYVREIAETVFYPEGYLFGFKVRKDLRNRGIGALLLYSMVRVISEEKGAGSVRALVDSKNVASMMVFERAGFRVVGRVDCFSVLGRTFHVRNELDR